MVKNGVLVTPLLTDSVLESITRDTILRIAKDILQIPVEERTVDRTELYTCEEAFLCGSAMEITPIYSVDGYKIGEEEGSITKKLHTVYLKMVTGELEGFSDWLTEVYGE